MNHCIVCNKEVQEETPMCEECQEKEIQAQVEHYNTMMDELGAAHEEVEARKKEYDLILELINDDRLVSNRYEFMAMLPELIAARDAYIKSVVNHFNEDMLDDHLKKIYLKDKAFYDPSWKQVPSIWGKRTWRNI